MPPKVYLTLEVILSHFTRRAQRFLLCTFAQIILGTSASAANLPTEGTEAVASKALRQLAIAFEENKGQVQAPVRFLSRAPGYQLFLTGDTAVVAFDAATPSYGSARLRAKAQKKQRAKAAFRMRLVGADPLASATGVEPLDYKSNYFRGASSDGTVTAVPNFGKVRFSDIYPGIDVVYYGKQQQLEYDLIVAPNADPALIKLRFDGVQRTAIAPSGDLSLTIGNRKFGLLKPVAYQDIDGHRKSVEATYALSADGDVGFTVAKYDRSKPLVIDPILSYSSFVWGFGGADVAVDAAGNAYVVGRIQATDLPATGYQRARAGSTDAFILKLDPTGSKVLYATYLGARNSETYGAKIAVDGAGNAYVTGTASSASFPVTAGVFQSTFEIGASFVTKLNATGSSLLYSTFVNGGTTITGIKVDASGNAFLTGSSSSLAATAGAYKAKSTYSRAPFVAKLNSNGSAMAFMTYLTDGGTGETANSIAIDSAGNAYVTGMANGGIPMVAGFQMSSAGNTDAYVAKLNSSGTALVYATYLGGAAADKGNGIAVDANGQAFITGITSSDNFPTTGGVFQPYKGYSGDKVSNAFITKLNAAGNALLYSSYLGGRWCLTAGVYSCLSFGSEGIDIGVAVAVDAAGYAYVGGLATSIGFPLVDAIHPIRSAGDEARSKFVAKVAPGGERLIYSTVVGGRTPYETLDGLALDASGSVYVVGRTSDNHPVTATSVKACCSNTIFKLSTGSFPTTLISSRNPSIDGEVITLSAQVLSTKLSGKVDFYSGSVLLGTAFVVNGSASISTSLAAGIHKMTATYSSDGKVSPMIIQTVNP